MGFFVFEYYFWDNQLMIVQYISVMLICRVFIRQAIGSFVSPGRKGCFSTITLDIINDKPD